MAETLESFSQRFGALEKSAFLAAIRCPILIDTAYSGGLSGLKPGFRTATIDGNEALALRLTAEQREVFMIKKREDAAFSGLVSLGRTSNLDVVIPRTGISKFHAYFSETPSGFQLTDKDSTNGTCVAGNRLTPDLPVLLNHEAAVQFANHSFTFLMPSRLFELLRSKRV